MNLCSPPTLHSTNSHQRKRKAQRTPSRSTSPSGHNSHHLPSQIRSLEIKVNSLQQSLSKLDEHTTTLINNQQAVLRVLTTMALPSSLATYLAPLYNLLNLTPIVTTDPIATDSPSPHPSPMESQFHLSPPYAAAPASDELPTAPTSSAPDELPTAPSSSASQLHPQPSAGLTQTPSSPPLLQHQSPPVINPPAPLQHPVVSSSTASVLPPRPPPPPPRAQPLSFVIPRLSFAQAATQGHHRQQSPTSITSNPAASPPPSPANPPAPQDSSRANRRQQSPTNNLPPSFNQIPPFHASILSMSPPERLATLLQPSIPPPRTSHPVSSLVVQVPLSRMARTHPTWSACRAIEAQSSYPILDANILPGLHPIPLFEIFFHTTHLESLRTFLQAQGLLHTSQPLLPQDIQRRSATYNRSKNHFMRAANLQGFSPEQQLLLLDHAQQRVSALPLARQHLVLQGIAQDRRALDPPPPSSAPPPAL